MVDTEALSNIEQQVIKSVSEHGTSVIDGNNTAILANALLKIGSDTFFKIADIVSEDTRLRKEILGKYYDIAEKTLDLNNESEKRLTEIYTNVLNIVNTALQRPDISAENFKDCLNIIRDVMAKAERNNNTTKSGNERIRKDSETVMRKEDERCSTGKEFAQTLIELGLGGITLYGLYRWIKKLT